jgi:glutamine amidotransferase-like uncharacterized protein
MYYKKYCYLVRKGYELLFSSYWSKIFNGLHLEGDNKSANFEIKDPSIYYVYEKLSHEFDHLNKANESSSPEVKLDSKLKIMMRICIESVSSEIQGIPFTAQLILQQTPNSIFSKSKKYILIIKDRLISNDSLEQMYERLLKNVHLNTYEVQIVNGDFLDKENWELHSVLLCIPGGRGPYSKIFSQNTNQRIIEFVRKGGGYLGICAGGYYGANRTIFEPGRWMAIDESGPLYFFPGTAEGSAYGVGRFEYTNENGSQVAKIFSEKISLNNVKAYFNGGCIFKLEGNNNRTTTLAKYVDLPGNPIAIVECQVDLGVAILSGVHIEYSYQAKGIQVAACDDMRRELEDSENSINDFFRIILNRFNIPGLLASSFDNSTKKMSLFSIVTNANVKSEQQSDHVGNFIAKL